jgi:hypothetical protein
MRLWLLYQLSKTNRHLRIKIYLQHIVSQFFQFGIVYHSKKVHLQDNLCDAKEWNLFLIDYIYEGLQILMSWTP